MPVDVEIPTTVIGLFGFVILIEGYIIIHLLKQIFELANKYAELLSENAKGAALIANGMSAIVTAVEYGKNYDALERKIDEITIASKTAVGRSRKS